MASHPLRRVAVLVETTRSYTRDLLAGVSQYLNENGPWSTFLELRAFESSLPPWLEGWDGDGILTRTHSEKMATAIAKTGVPTVELRSTDYCDDIPFVGMDNALIGESVAAHFLNHGYRRFATYTLDSESFFRERVSNFVTFVTDADCPCELLPAQSDSTPKDWEKHQHELIQWLNSLTKPVGIFAANDQLGVRLIDACRRANISVPEEVAVVGCENETTLCEFSSPTLTSVQFDGKTVGYRAAGLLDCLMNGESPDENQILIPPIGMKVRASSDEFVLEDPLILRAIRLIRQEALNGITVAQVCDALRISRSTLERRMKRAIGRNTKTEILRIRFREVNRLLRNTNLTLDAIAGHTGFSHTHYLQSTYRAKFGITPGQFRKQANRENPSGNN